MCVPVPSTEARPPNVAVHGAESVLPPSIAMVLNKEHACGLFSLLGKILENYYYCLIIHKCRYF